MKRISKGYDRHPSLSESLAYVCSLLSPFGLLDLSPESLLLAAANHPSASPSMWSSLHQLICLQLASPSSSIPVENVLLSIKEANTSPDGLICFVKFYLSLWGFPYTSSVFSLSYNTEESQNLLVALAWLISRCDIFKRALKARIKKLSPHLSPLTVTDVSKTSVAVDRARQGRARSEEYINKLMVALDKVADVRVRARARSQQALMLYGRVRMSIMALHSLLSYRAKLIHNLNQIQLDFKIKNEEGLPYCQFEMHLLQHREALEKHFEALDSIKNIGEEMAQCEKHEKTFWQWLVAVILKCNTQRYAKMQPLQKLRILSDFCTVSVSPFVEYLHHQLVKEEHSIRLSRVPTPVEASAEGPVTNLNQLSLPDTDNEEVRRLFLELLFQTHGVTFVYEIGPTGKLRRTTNSDAESIMERSDILPKCIESLPAVPRISSTA